MGAKKNFWTRLRLINLSSDDLENLGGLALSLCVAILRVVTLLFGIIHLKPVSGVLRIYEIPLGSN